MSTEITRYKEQEKQMVHWLEQLKPQIAKALPHHLGKDRFVQLALFCLRADPKLLACTPQSLLACFVETAKLGLEPGRHLGQAWLVPFKIKGALTATLIIGYKGYIDLGYRSGKVSWFGAEVVRKGDTFSFEKGTSPFLRHIPQGDPEAEITHAYSLVKLNNGDTTFDVMSRKEVDRIRQRAKAKDNGPWDTDFAQMAKKTSTIRHSKVLPMTTEMQQAIRIDEAAEAGIEQPFTVAPTDFIDMPSLADAATEQRQADLAADLAKRRTEQGGEPAKRKPGRPAGSKNKPKPAQAPPEPVADKMTDQQLIRAEIRLAFKQLSPEDQQTALDRLGLADIDAIENVLALTDLRDIRAVLNEYPVAKP